MAPSSRRLSGVLRLLAIVAILCTLGIYSIYSLSVVGKTISWKVATASYAAVAFLGTLAGIATRAFS